VVTGGRRYFDQEPTAFVPKGVLALPDGRCVHKYHDKNRGSG
jgi:hypothetical protein